MKVVTSKQMAYIESQAYRNGSTELEFMEEAGKGIAEWVSFYIEQKNLSKEVYLLCGKGNNAGDAYTAGVHLLKWGFSVVAYQIFPLPDCSVLCRANHERFRGDGGKVREINNVHEEFIFSNGGVILDGLFGTGFKGAISEPVASAIRIANQSRLPILSIDIPSGLSGDKGVIDGEAIKATETIFLQLPKTGFFLEDGWNHVGKLRHVDFGLPQDYIDESERDLDMLYAEELKLLLPPLVATRHKYQAGLVVGLAGSPGMPGAAILTSEGSMRAGAGIVRLLHPAGMEAELSSSPYELIKIAYQPHETDKIIKMMNEAAATFIGPGIGRSPEVRKLLRVVLPKLEKPCVIDADAITLIAEEKIGIPQKAILTPHIGEMMRLLQHSAPKPASKEFLFTCQNYTEKHGITLVLKGGPTFIFNPHEPPMVNPYGDPGMATAGSGDVLTGILAALLAQGLSLKNAATLGVYLHGAAGEFAADDETSYCMIASDILRNLPYAFFSLKE